jgi:hypothetical protein
VQFEAKVQGQQKEEEQVVRERWLRKKEQNARE